MNVSRQLAECLLRLRNGPEFEAYRAYLAGRKKKEQDNCVNFDGVNLHRAQGHAKAFGEMEELIETAPGLFEKLKDQR